MQLNMAFYGQLSQSYKFRINLTENIKKVKCS